jgi:hypothetical protein
MTSLPGLGFLRDDPDLRALISDVATQKLKADLKALEAYAQLAGKLTDNRRREDAGGILKRILREHLQFYRTLVELSHGFHQRLIDELDESDRGKAAPVNGAKLAVAAPAGGTGRGRFTVVNVRQEAVLVVCRISPFVCADGSRLLAPDVVFEPASASIDAGSELTFTVAVSVPSHFAVGERYLANISADGVDEFHVLLELAVDPPGPPEAAAAPDRRATTADAAPARRRRRARPPRGAPKA